VSERVVEMVVGGMGGRVAGEPRTAPLHMATKRFKLERGDLGMRSFTSLLLYVY
jgi:hypothetical protein